MSISCTGTALSTLPANIPLERGSRQFGHEPYRAIRMKEDLDQVSGLDSQMFPRGPENSQFIGAGRPANTRRAVRADARDATNWSQLAGVEVELGVPDRRPRLRSGFCTP